MMITAYIILLISSLALTYMIRIFAVKKNIIDIPNQRSSHKIPTPRGGGLAIVITWFAGLSYLFFSNNIQPHLFYALLPGILLAIISFLDDIFTLSPLVRLIVQFITVSISIYFLNGINPIDFGFFIISSPYILIPVVIIGMLWFINLFNFLDGIDAYASVEAIFISCSIFLFTNNSILLILSISILGFLFLNWPKAKIFMGDVGSTQLGFILVVLGIYFHNSGEFNIINWLILSSLFWFDASLTLFRRWRNEERINLPHKKHAYQRIVQYGFSHQKTVLLSLLLNLTLLIIMYIFIDKSNIIFIILIIVILYLYIIVRLIDSKFPFKKD